MVMFPVALSAQTSANSFRQLESRHSLTKGDTILVSYTQDAGGEHEGERGTFLGLNGSTIDVRLDSGVDIELAEREVRRIERERKDSVWNGAFIGGGVGLAYGAGSMVWFCSSAWECNEVGPTAGYILSMAGIGFAVGALVDTATGKSQVEVVYIAPNEETEAVTFSVSPLLSREQQGIRFTISW